MPKTRSAAGAGSIRKRADGTWEARYTTGYDPGTGKQRRKSVYGKTQAEVRKKLAAAVAALDEGVYFEPKKTTVGNWLDVWLTEYAEPVLKPLTVQAYGQQIRNHIKPALGALQLSELDTTMIQSFYNALRSGKAKSSKKPLSAKSIKNIHGVLHCALEKAVELRYIRFNPADAVTIPSVKKPEINVMEPAEMAQFLSALSGERYRNLFVLALFTGMRQSELLGLSWKQVDLQRGTITVSQQLQCKGGKYFLSTPKSNKPRVVMPAPFVMEALWAEHQAQAARRIRAGSAWDNPMDLVFTNELGSHLVHRTVVKHFKRLTEELELPHLRFHDLRHTYAVTALQAGDDIKTVQGNLGHATASFTLDVYGHVTDQMKKDSADRMQKTIEQLKSAQ